MFFNKRGALALAILNHWHQPFSLRSHGFVCKNDVGRFCFRLVPTIWRSLLLSLRLLQKDLGLKHTTKRREWPVAHGINSHRELAWLDGAPDWSARRTGFRVGARSPGSRFFVLYFLLHRFLKWPVNITRFNIFIDQVFLYHCTSTQIISTSFVFKNTLKNFI